jgi:hypothetical protein
MPERRWLGSATTPSPAGALGGLITRCTFTVPEQDLRGAHHPDGMDPIRSAVSGEATSATRDSRRSGGHPISGRPFARQRSHRVRCPPHPVCRFALLTAFCGGCGVSSGRGLPAGGPFRLAATTVWRGLRPAAREGNEVAGKPPGGIARCASRFAWCCARMACRQAVRCLTAPTPTSPSTTSRNPRNAEGAPKGPFPSAFLTT